MDKIIIPNIKCLNCVHQKLCFNLLGGMNLQMKAEDCKDFLDIDKDVWIAPCKRGDNLYIIDGAEIYPATVLCIEASLMPNEQISWSIKVSYLDEYLDEHYTWETWNYKLFKTKEEAKRSDLYVWNKKLSE